MDPASHPKSIDCDVHPNVPGMRALLPYLEEFWRDSVEDRGIDSLESISYPPNAPITARPDFRDAKNRAATSVGELQAQVFERWGAGLAICNCLYGVQLLLNEDMARAFARAVNDWMVKEWLDDNLPAMVERLVRDEIQRIARGRK